MAAADLVRTAPVCFALVGEGLCCGFDGARRLPSRTSGDPDPWALERLKKLSAVLDRAR